MPGLLALRGHRCVLVFLQVCRLCWPRLQVPMVVLILKCLIFAEVEMAA